MSHGERKYPTALESRGGDEKLCSPSAARNRDPILEVLRRHLPAAATVLEIGSGTGEHAIHFARALPELTWIPSDPDHAARVSISAWVLDSALNNVHEPLDLDARDDPEVLSLPAIDALVAINVVHISPWSTLLGLLDHAGCLLGPGGTLFLYGPFQRDGRHTAPSNAAFDDYLREQNPAWGVRDLAQIEAEAARRGLAREALVPMPANNLSVILRRREVAERT